ncbi:MAG TPA: NADP-dependent phosphogluconate dehydrogenase [Terriglobia bacterium]|jgi:6-phosphogluconate dehydrogenase|nr:NADP-dependent phosphogluconate dehydrogenase [Terriglobia bacterium]
MDKRHLGMVGLGVMGKNLALNAESKGFSVAGFDVDREKAQKVAAETAGKIHVTNSWQEFVDALETPRRVWMMVPAGKAVDAVIQELKPYLTRDDIMIDGGNSYYKDTERRARELEAEGLRFFGMGVSGGEEGALHGPSLMPGGHEESYRHLESVLTRMAAQTSDGPCCTYLGPGGAGHYVKMVHNGIEYGIMQTICEAYDILKNITGLTGPEIRDVFADWNNDDLGSFLLEISIVVLGKIDPETNQPLVDLVLDTAGQKGTGKWTAQDALDLGVPVPTLTAAVIARILSGAKQDRMEASEILRGPKKKFTGDKSRFIARVRDAYTVTVVACYAQGFDQLRAASNEYQYHLKFDEVARIWKGGCIIRAKMLDPIRAAFRRKPDLKNLMLDRFFSRLVNRKVAGLREVVKKANELGTPCPSLSNTLAYIDSYRQKRLPANLLQAQRDYFGAHTYQRIDKEGVFHTEWDK